MRASTPAEKQFIPSVGACALGGNVSTEVMRAAKHIRSVVGALLDVKALFSTSLREVLVSPVDVFSRRERTICN